MKMSLGETEMILRYLWFEILQLIMCMFWVGEIKWYGFKLTISYPVVLIFWWVNVWTAIT
jgi:hypothetical protein